MYMIAFLDLVSVFYAVVYGNIRIVPYIIYTSDRFVVTNNLNFIAKNTHPLE